MKAKARLLVVALAAGLVADCATPGSLTPVDSSEIDIRELPARAPGLEGQRITTYGFVFVKDSSLNVVSQRKLEGQVCIGLLIRQDKLAALRVNDEKWLRVTGILESQGCGGTRVCHNSCGPVAIRDPEFSKRK
jgi:hypothetical protein